MRFSRPGLLRYVVAWSAVLLAVLGAFLGFWAGTGAGGAGLSSQVQSLVHVVVLAGAGVVIRRYARARAVGAVLLGSAVVWSLWLLLSGMAVAAMAGGWSGSSLLWVLSEAVWPLILGVPLVLLPQVYPNGSLPGRGYRRTLVVTVAALAGDAILTAVIMATFGPSAVNDPTTAPATFRVAFAVHAIVWLGVIVTAVVVLGLRWRGASRLVRQQIGTLCTTLLATLVLLLITIAGILSDTAENVLWTLWPVAVVASIGWAVLRHNLYDVRVVVRRAAIYAALTAALTAVFSAVYFAVLALVTQRFAQGALWWAAVLAAVAVVLCAEPARHRIQGLLERRVLGERGEPLKALALLGERISDGDEQELLDAAAHTVAAAVRAPAVALAVYRSGDLQDVALTGQEDREPSTVPLLHRGERLGELRVSPRTPRESYGKSDHALLHQMADHVAALVYGLRRDAELAEARQQALTIGAEERSRLGRDLHDGLGPLLAGAGLAAEALRRGMPPASSDEVEAAQLAQRLRSAATEVRRVAHGLQPRALEDGLASAVTDHIATLTGPGVPGISATINVQHLPAPIEQAAYLVVLEALNNVLRHAEATHAVVTLNNQNGSLLIAVQDDGLGLPMPYVSGMGITSMRSRVQALGGTIIVQPGPSGGTLLRVKIPVLS